MFEQQQRVGAVTGHDLGVDRPLQVPGRLVVHRPRGQPELLVTIPSGERFAEAEADHIEHRPRLLRGCHQCVVDKRLWPGECWGSLSGMDDFDGERFARGGQSLAAASARPGRRAGRRSARGRGEVPASRVIHRDEDREELRCAQSGHPAAIRVRALSEAGRDQLRREVQLLATLEVGGIGAAPAVLEVEDEGYVREGAAPLRGRRGRRSAEDATPGTSERQGQARARESLEALIDALHDRGWVLGAPLGEGAGIRADGSVTVLDLSGLRPQEATGARLEDRRWVDAVLRDEDRTLRRRIDARGTPLPAVQFLEAEQEAPSLRPLPAPTASRQAAPSQRLRPRRARSGRPGAELGRRVREVLRAPRPRRIALLSAAAVLIAGGALGSGAWWLVPESSAPAPPAGAAPSASSPADGSTGAPEGTEHPRIIDPLSLATDLAHTRYEYVTGHGTDAVAAPGSPAEEADEQVRRAYQGTVVEGGQPEVLAAHVVAGPTPQGTARLEAELVTPAHTVAASDGASAPVPGTAAAPGRPALPWRLCPCR